jgi:amino acid transporter
MQLGLEWRLFGIYYTYIYSVILTCTRKFVPYSSENALEPIYSKIGRQLTIPVIATILAPAIVHTPAIGFVQP